MGPGGPCEWNFGGCEVSSFLGNRYRGIGDSLCYQPLAVWCDKTNASDLFVWQKQMSEGCCLKFLLRFTWTGHSVFCGTSSDAHLLKSSLLISFSKKKPVIAFVQVLIGILYIKVKWCLRANGLLPPYSQGTARDVWACNKKLVRFN